MQRKWYEGTGGFSPAFEGGGCGQSGVGQKEADKAIKALSKEEKVVSPKICF